jgi:hypothetical protein
MSQCLCGLPMPPVNIRDLKVYLIYTFIGDSKSTYSERVIGHQKRFDLACEYLLSLNSNKIVIYQMDQFVQICFDPSAESYGYLSHCQVKYILPDMLPPNYEVILSLHDPSDLSTSPVYVEELIDSRNPDVLPKFNIFCQGWMNKSEFVNDPTLFKLQSIKHYVERFPVGIVTLEMCTGHPECMFLVSQFASWQGERQKKVLHILLSLYFCFMF